MFTDAMVQYKNVVGELDDVGKCTPVTIGASVQALLLALVFYGIAGEEDDYRHRSDDAIQTEMKWWLVTLITVTVARSAVAARQCAHASGALLELFNALRVFTVVMVCVASGADETVSETD